MGALARGNARRLCRARGRRALSPGGTGRLLRSKAEQVSRIYWDTMLFIYWLENNPQYAKRVGAIRARMQERGDYLITGAFTFGEVLAGPYRIGAVQVADETKRLFGAAGSAMRPFVI